MAPWQTAYERAQRERWLWFGFGVVCGMFAAPGIDTIVRIALRWLGFQ